MPSASTSTFISPIASMSSLSHSMKVRSAMAPLPTGTVSSSRPRVSTKPPTSVWGSWGTGMPDRHVREAGLDPENPAIRQALDLAHQLIGFPRHLSQHVGGFVPARSRRAGRGSARSRRRAATGGGGSRSAGGRSG
jgi:hypothetical protein